MTTLTERLFQSPKNIKMKTTIKKLKKDEAEFWLSTRKMRRATWVLQNKRKGMATISSSTSGITKVVSVDTVCYI
jgi:hypothetical protein